MTTPSGQPRSTIEREKISFARLSAGAKLALVILAVLSPIALLAILELGIRLSRVDTELVPHDSVEIAIPAWLAADENFASGLQPGVKAANVLWLRNFVEARYIWTQLKPNVQVDALNPYNAIELAKGVTFRFSSNGDGFRGREFRPKAPGVIRIVCIGDSSTFGWGVDDDYTYPRLLEARLNKPGGPTVEVFNLGIPGFTSRHGLGVLRHYTADLDADFYVFSFGANDARRVLRPVDEVLSEHEGWRGTVRFTALRLKTYQLVRKLTLDRRDPSARYAERPQLVQSVSDDQYATNLKTMIRIARQRDARAVLMTVCAPPAMVNQMRVVADGSKVPMVNSLDLLYERFEDLKAHRVYADEIRYYERLYGLDAMAKNWRLYVTTDGCHPNRAGMSLIADAIAQVVSPDLKAE